MGRVVAVTAVPGPQEAAEVGLLDVVRVLSETYTDAGVMTWLTARNAWLEAAGGAPRSPADLIQIGRIVEVYAAACRIEGGL